MPRHRLTLPLAAAASALLLVTAPVTAQDATPQKPAWHALPAETMLALRVPQPRAFAQTLRQRTRLGAVAFSDERFERIRRLLVEQAGEEWDSFQRELNRYGLSEEDLPRLFDGPQGLAVVPVFTADPSREAPLFFVLAWADYEPELAGRLMTAIERSFEDRREEMAGARRTDFELAGHRVSHYSTPQFGPDREMTWDMPEDWQNMSQEEMDAHWESQRKQAEEAQTVEVDRTNVLLTRMGGRVLAAVGGPQSAERVRQMLAEGRTEIDWDEVTHVEALTELFGRFVAGQGGEDGAFAGRMLGVAGLRDALPTGVPMFELLFDFPRVRELVDESARRDAAEGSAEVQRVLRMLGLDGLGTIAIRYGLDGHVMRGGIFVESPAPRRGLLELLDQPTMSPEPPAWVAADVGDYSHLSFDLAAAYAHIKRLVLDEFGQQAEQGFQMAEGAVMGWTQTELSAVLASLGHEHRFLTYQPRLVEVEMPDFEQPFNEQTGQWPTKTQPVPQNRFSYVAAVGDEGIWQRVMQALGGFAGMSQGAMKYSEEQGFAGWRVEEDTMPVGLFLGKGFLSLSFGQGVTEQTLAMLRSPGQGAAQLRQSDLFREGAALINLRDGLLFQISNLNQQILGTIDMVSAVFDTAVPAENREQADTWLDVLPTREEMDGMFGVGIGQGYVTDHGLVLENALQLTPAE